MMNEPKSMQEIHRIRVNNYENEKKLSSVELEEKRRLDRINVEKTINEYGLKVRAVV